MTFNNRIYTLNLILILNLFVFSFKAKSLFSLSKVLNTPST